jgi:hypothetical protein
VPNKVKTDSHQNIPNFAFVVAAVPNCSVPISFCGLPSCNSQKPFPMILAEIFFIYFYQRGLQPQKAGSSKMNTALEYSTRVVQEGGRRCKKSSTPDPSKNTFNEPAKSAYFTVRGQSCFSRLPKY